MATQKRRTHKATDSTATSGSGSMSHHPPIRAQLTMSQKQSPDKHLIFQLSVLLLCLAKLSFFASLTVYAMYMYTGKLHDMYDWAVDAFKNTTGTLIQDIDTKLKNTILANIMPDLFTVAFVLSMAVGLAGVVSQVSIFAFVAFPARCTQRHLVLSGVVDTIWLLVLFVLTAFSLNSLLEVNQIQIHQLTEGNFTGHTFSQRASVSFASAIVATIAASHLNGNGTYTLINRMQKNLDCCGFYDPTDWWSKTHIPIPAYTLYKDSVDLPPVLSINFSQWQCECFKFREDARNRSMLNKVAMNPRLCYTPSGCCSGWKASNRLHNRLGCNNITKGVDLNFSKIFHIHDYHDFCHKEENVETLREFIVKHQLVVPGNGSLLNLEPCIPAAIELMKAKMLHFFLIGVALICSLTFSLVCNSLMLHAIRQLKKQATRLPRNTASSSSSPMPSESVEVKKAQ